MAFKQEDLDNFIKSRLTRVRGGQPTQPALSQPRDEFLDYIKRKKGIAPGGGLTPLPKV